jgi:hypothetical protein
MARPKLLIRNDYGRVGLDSKKEPDFPAIADPGGSDEPIIEPRSKDHQADGLIRQAKPMRVVSGEQIDLIRRMIGVSVVEDQAKLSAVVEAMEAVREQTGNMLKAGIQVGRELIEMKKELSVDEGARAIRGAADLFPGWSSGNLKKMMGAAELFDSGWVDRSILPISYSVLYQISLMNRPAIQKAVERKLITPRLTRSEAVKVRLLMATAEAEPDVCSASEHPMLPEVAKLDARILKLRADLRAATAERLRILAKLRRTTGKSDRTV